MFQSKILRATEQGYINDFFILQHEYHTTFPLDQKDRIQAGNSPETMALRIRGRGFATI